jgi:hypothetical protein
MIAALMFILALVSLYFVFTFDSMFVLFTMLFSIIGIFAATRHGKSNVLFTYTVNGRQYTRPLDTRRRRK